MSAADAERRELLELILRHSFERRPVVLSSGKHSDFYLDLRTTMMRPRGIELAGFFVRKEAKKHGLAKRIEGGFRAGQAVALVEDTMTTGGSTLEALDVVEEAGGKVARVLCIVDRGEGAAEAFAQRGLALESLYTRADLPL